MSCAERRIPGEDAPELLLRRWRELNVQLGPKKNHYGYGCVAEGIPYSKAG